MDYSRCASSAGGNVKYYLYRDDELIAVTTGWVPGFPDTIGLWHEDGEVLPAEEVAKVLMGTYSAEEYLRAWSKRTGGWFATCVEDPSVAWVVCTEGRCVTYPSDLECVRRLYNAGLSG